ncbi:MAG: hypothetical protein CVV04_12120 [Firmicutes bacterium HGW-Firmicutes-9]|jgi:hypothetical protein|nr:MAG: hypothetical protein CVV04_12120 [Firmicutes bacterium HGW-Firmicutes-9]
MKHKSKEPKNVVLGKYFKQNQEREEFPRCFNPILPTFGSGGSIGSYPMGQHEVCFQCVACGKNKCVVDSEYVTGGSEDERCEVRVLIMLIVWMWEQSNVVSKAIKDYFVQVERFSPLHGFIQCSNKDKVNILLGLQDFQVRELYNKCKKIRKCSSGIGSR